MASSLRSSSIAVLSNLDPVDRILRQQQAQRAAQEEAMRKKAQEPTALVSRSKSLFSEKTATSDWSGQTAVQPDVVPPPPGSSAPATNKALDMVKRMTDARHSLQPWQRLHSAFSSLGGQSADTAGPSSAAGNITGEEESGVSRCFCVQSPTLD